MHTQTPFDSFCTNKSCLQANTAFFNYSQSNNPHSDHQCVSIHKRQIAKFINSQQDKLDFSLLLEQSITNRLQNSSHIFNKMIIDFLNTKFLTSFLQVTKQKMYETKEIDFQRKLEEGNIQLLNQIIKYRESDKNLSFNSFLKLEELNQMEENIKNKFNNITHKIIDIIDVAFDNIDQLVNLDQEFYQSKKNQQHSQSIMEVQQSQIHNMSYTEQQFKECQRQFLPFNKTLRKNKPISKQPRINGRKQQKSYQYTPQIQFQNDISYYSKQIKILNPKEIIIQCCHNAQQLLQLLTQKHSSIQGLYIFSSKFATQSIIIKIIQRFKSLKKLGFNCLHMFTNKVLRLKSEEQWKRFKKLELKWSFQFFFDEYYKMHYFPIKKWKYLQRRHEVYPQQQIWNQVSNNQTIWITKNSSIQSIKAYKKNLSKIQVLHFSTDANSNFGHVKNIIDIPTLTNLTILHLYNVSFAGIQDKFTTFILNNKFLTTLLINQCSYLMQINQILPCLRKLHFLTKLAIIARRVMINIEPDCIFNLVNLQSLYLTEVSFSRGETELDGNFLKGFRRLTKLKHLSLYSCKPIDSSLFENISPEVLSNLQTLSIGDTKIDNSSLRYFLPMKNLKNLNIDQTFITKRALLQTCKQYYRLHSQYWGLQLLSIQQKQPQSKKSKQKIQNSIQSVQDFENFRELGNFLPQISYLCIFGCSYLKDYNFQQFKRLRTIAIDPQMHKVMVNNIPHINKFIIEGD